jgi:hypothetical protein
MQNRDGVQKGPQDHAEGQHGSKTHSKFLEQLHSGSNGVATNPENGNGAAEQEKQKPHHAAHRLFEDREQHDEAEKNSEKRRLHREIERHHLPPDELLIAPVKTVPPSESP